MSKVTHTVSVDGGKYKFIARLGYVIDVDRHGETWVTGLDAPKAVASLMAELDAARVVLAAARRTVDMHHEGIAPIGSLRSALELHGRLVDDREPPSAWCGEPPDRAAEATVEDRPLLTDNELTMAQQAVNDANHAGQQLRASALQKLLGAYKRSTP